MKVVVLGAGVIGVTSAWYLAGDGHDVTVLDRQPQAGLETSFANGGQVSVSHAEPWANPGAPAKIYKWLGREDAPLLFRLRADPRQWSWGLRFLVECLPARTRRNTLTILRLDAELPAVALSPYWENYLAATIEHAAARKNVTPPAWTAKVRPLEEPVFGSTLRSLRLHLLINSPPAFCRRNIFIDSSVGGRV